MELRLIAAYALIAFILVAAVVFVISVIRKRRRHRQVMSGRRIHPS